jgi:hypothetical protein
LFLFDEFHLPKRVAVAHVQGLRGHNVHQGDLSTIKSVSSTTSAVEIYRLGHRLRWLKQMATSAVLQVISSSPGELQPVFDAILDNAVRICGSQNATL